MLSMRKWIITLLAAALPCSPLPSQAAPPRVVATIPPLHSLASALMQGVGEPQLLIHGNLSPHHFVPRPSQRKTLNQANLVLWVGAEVESFMPKTLQALPPSVRTVAMQDVPGLVSLPTRNPGVWDQTVTPFPGDAPKTNTPRPRYEQRRPRERDPSDEHEREFHPHHREDTHLWLDPTNALVWSRYVASLLVSMDQENTALYLSNSANLEIELTNLDWRIRHNLAEVADRRYIVFHDAYHYFENRYHLNPIGPISVGGGQPPGALRIMQMRRLVRKHHITCLFSEPQFDAAVAQTVIEGSNAEIHILDPLGTDLEPGAELYGQLLTNMSTTLVECLK